MKDKTNTFSNVTRSNRPVQLSEQQSQKVQKIII